MKFTVNITRPAEADYIVLEDYLAARRLGRPVAKCIVRLSSQDCMIFEKSHG